MTEKQNIALNIFRFFNLSLSLNQLLFRLLARDAGGETEGVLLNETVPAWVVDIVVEKKLPKFIKVIIFD